MSFNTWKTIKIGTGLKTSNDFRLALKEKGFGIRTGANRIFDIYEELPVAQTETEIDLIKVSVKDIVYFNDRSATTREVYGCAKTYFNLELCLPEVGPQLRLQYLDQPKGERLRIAMQLIKPGEHFAFDVIHDSSMELCGYSDPNNWDQNDVFVFRRHR